MENRKLRWNKTRCQMKPQTNGTGYDTAHDFLWTKWLWIIRNKHSANDFSNKPKWRKAKQNKKFDMFGNETVYSTWHHRVCYSCLAECVHIFSLLINTLIFVVSRWMGAILVLWLLSLIFLLFFFFGCLKEKMFCDIIYVCCLLCLCGEEK